MPQCPICATPLARELVALEKVRQLQEQQLNDAKPDSDWKTLPTAKGFGDVSALAHLGGAGIGLLAWLAWHRGQTGSAEDPPG